MKIIALITLVGISTAGKNNPDKKSKDKKSRMLRNIRKVAPVTLLDGVVTFDENAEIIQCLTSKTAEYENKGTLNYTEASIMTCQRIMSEIQKADSYLQLNFGVSLLSEEEIDYEGVQSDMWESIWGISGGPNAKNTIIALKAICEEMIPEETPALGGDRCRTDTESEMTMSECRVFYRVHELKKSKKLCRKTFKITQRTN